MSATISGRKANRSRRCAAVDASRALTLINGIGHGRRVARHGAERDGHRAWPTDGDPRSCSTCSPPTSACDRCWPPPWMERASSRTSTRSTARCSSSNQSAPGDRAIVGMPPTTLSHYVRAMRERGHLHERRNPRTAAPARPDADRRARSGRIAGPTRASSRNGRRFMDGIDEGSEGRAGRDRGRGGGRPGPPDQRLPSALLTSDRSSEPIGLTDATSCRRSGHSTNPATLAGRGCPAVGLSAWRSSCSTAALAPMHHLPALP